MGILRCMLLWFLSCQCLLLAISRHCDAHDTIPNVTAEPELISETRRVLLPEPRPEDPGRPGPGEPRGPEDPARPRHAEPGGPEDPGRPRPRPGEPGGPGDPRRPRPRPGEPGGPEDPGRPRPRPGEPGGPEDPRRPRPGDPGRPDNPGRPLPGDPERPDDPRRPRPGDPGRPDDPGRPRPGEPGRPRPEDPPRPRPDERPRPRPEEPERPRPDEPPRPRPDEPPRPRPEEPPKPRPEEPERPKREEPPRPRPEEPPRPRPEEPEDPPGPRHQEPLERPRPRPEEPHERSRPRNEEPHERPRPRPEEPHERPRPRPEEPPRPKDPDSKPEKRRLHEYGLVHVEAEQPNAGWTLTSRLQDFPKPFIFGTASAAYQYEGAASEGGRGPSIWDIWAHTEGNTYQGDTGDVAVDQYHRYKEDVQLMKQMSADAYRFSISWSRIYPSGRGEHVNQEGVDYYNNLINELLANDIQPFVTLFHWDLPQGLEDAYEGWLSSRIVDDFAAYAETCYSLFGDRVKHWITFNEPHTFVPYGYDIGVFPPGRCTPAFNSRCKKGNSSTETYLAAHNVLLSHAAAYKVYKDKYQKVQGGLVGITLDTTWYRPLTNSLADKDAAERALVFQLGWYLDPIVFGKYPKEMQTLGGDRLPKFSKNEVKTIRRSYDFIGLNHYTSQYAADAPSRSPGSPASYFSDQNVRVTAEKDGKLIGPKGGTDWLYVVPDGVEHVLLWVKDRYDNPPVYITENGYADNSSLPREQLLKDDIRTSYYKDYISYIRRAISKEVDVRGYFAWSLLDNFEWGSGYSVRFGLHYVDYEDNLRRYPKDSAVWFRKYLSGQQA